MSGRKILTMFYLTAAIGTKSEIYDPLNDAQALAMTMMDKPMAVNMCFQREYAERYDWLKQQFTDWVFTFSTSVLYYEDFDTTDEDTRNIQRQAWRLLTAMRRASYRLT